MKSSETDFFNNVTVSLCSTFDIEKSLYLCFSHIERELPLDTIYLTWYDSQVGTLQVFAEADRSGGRKKDDFVLLPRQYREMYDAKELHSFATIFKPKEGGIFNTVIKDGLNLKSESFIVLPLAIDGVHVGAVVLGSDKPDVFTEEQANMLSLVHDPFAIAVSNSKMFDELTSLKSKLDENNRFFTEELNRSENEIIGEKFGLKSVMEMVRQVAPKNSPVLLLGETGVGKELIANRIHFLSDRKDQPFIKVNCGAMAESIIDSELFGHEKGAFTDANYLKKGYFERADKGTIFLDEIGELPQKVQVRLLRVLQQKEIERVGGSQTVLVDIRVIAATHRNLQEMVENGEFREDLLFRLNVFPIEIPPLNERKEDIPALTAHFLKQKCAKFNLHDLPPVSPESIEELMNYNWVGNVRELENEIERALIRYNCDGWMTFYCLETEEDKQNEALSDDLSLDEVIKTHIKKVLEKTKGRVNGAGGAAETLGINPNTLRNKMKKLGIFFGRNKD